MCLYYLFCYCLRRYIFSKIDHIISIVFQKNLNNILSDIVDISLNCCNYNSALLLLVAALCLHKFLYGSKTSLCSLGTHQKLWQKHGSFLEALSYNIKCRHKLCIDDFKRLLFFKHLLCHLIGWFLKTFDDACL